MLACLCASVRAFLCASECAFSRGCVLTGACACAGLCVFKFLHVSVRARVPMCVCGHISTHVRASFRACMRA